MKKSVTGYCAMAIGALFATHTLAYEAGPVANGGKVTGKVSFKGTAPAPKKLPITKDNAVCGTGEREIVEVAARGGALAGAVVYVAKIEKGKEWGALSAPVLDQKGCKFAPDTLVVKKDAEVVVRNSDPVLHNIHTYEIIGAVRRTMFNVGQPDKGDLKQPIKVRRANVIKVECDAHDFMHAWALAVDNPYAIATRDDGSFALDGLPAGEYEVRAWHPILGEKSVKVSVPAGGAATAAFEFTK
ncbi:MAG: carboxypeptidase regulatory-like domain-containing protein [Rhodocyclaceae bacterium]|nr:carboxypeptidase regulatory-like domain-containing protein [Rhodocyclaceae bacterium]